MTEGGCDKTQSFEETKEPPGRKEKLRKFSPLPHFSYQTFPP